VETVIHRTATRARRPELENLEGRMLPSTLAPSPAAAKRSALVALRHPSIAVDPAGVAAIMTALEGGMGREWVALVRSELRNPGSVIAGFVSGRYSAYSVPGLTARTPGIQAAFRGQAYDQLLPTVVGAAVFKRNVVELAAIMRWPFRDPAPALYVFSFDRGAGGSLGPRFAAVPGITPDALVTITAGPYGSSDSGAITDLTTGATQAIPPSAIKIKGSVLRVYLNTSQLPSRGLPIAKYRFAFWTQTAPGNDLATMASFAPAGSMIPIGVLKGMAVTR
jgi:hypothetical protein